MALNNKSALKRSFLPFCLGFIIHYKTLIKVTLTLPLSFFLCTDGRLCGCIVTSMCVCEYKLYYEIFLLSRGGPRGWSSEVKVIKFDDGPGRLSGGGGPLIDRDGNRKSQKGGGASFRFSEYISFFMAEPSPRRARKCYGVCCFESRVVGVFCGFIGQV